MTLTLENNAETGFLGEEEFSPDEKKYLALEDQGLVRLFTIRKERELLGYALFFVTPHLHYPSTTFALQDALFVSKGLRGISAFRFIQFTDLELKSEGVQVVYRHVSGKRDYGRVLKHLGYSPIETGYARRL